ncbi:hypothetical protein BC830DRAFT_52202 [Chytriomyces sp. MP71]|nr:hypothetical protein BC830DRAFT_52202 [Chytriomyces sp. MP71]
MQRKHTSSLLRVLSLYVIAIVSLAQRDVPPGVLQPPAADLAKLADSRQNNQESSQPTQPIYIAPASLAEAETAINWTQYHLNPKFVNGPACSLANNTLGWNTLRNPDGSFVTQIFARGDGLQGGSCRDYAWIHYRIGALCKCSGPRT